MQAIWFAYKAVSALANAKGTQYISGVEQLVCDEPRRFRTGLLEQLGRLLEETNDKRLVRDVAPASQADCATEPTMTTRKAEAIIRTARRECEST